MPALLEHPAVQAGLAPFVVALGVAALLFGVRLAGLAVAAALGTAVALIGGFAVPPVSAQQKLLLVSLAVPLLGMVGDFAFKPARSAAPVLGVLAAGCAIWVGWNVLRQKDLAGALLAGAGMAALAGWLTASSLALRADSIRAGAAALMLGLGLGAIAWLAASRGYAPFAMAVGAGAGAFLFVQVLLGRTIAAGATFTLSAGAACGLLAAGVLLGSPGAGYAALALALVPVAVHLPLPRAGVVVQSLVACAWAGLPALAACLLAWPEVQRRLGL